MHTIFPLPLLSLVNEQPPPPSPYRRGTIEVPMSATATVRCGSEPTLNFLTHGGLKREYYMYFPSRACEATDNKTEQPKFPLIVAVHCFGCSWEGEFKKHKAIADEKGIALLMPRGITKSWNAIECCGVALDTHLDDVGFINAAVYEMLGKGHVDSGAVFATGFSNGGFMTSRIALQQSSHSNSSAAWLVAAAPTAGELGDGSLYDAATVAVPVMLHHSIEDTAVRWDGCGGDKKCCCGIRAGQAKGLAVEEVFQRWVKINKCTGGVTDDVPLATVLGTPATTLADGGIICSRGDKCEATTILCRWRGQHGQWAKDFPGTPFVADFFLREACRKSRGTWTGDSCDCGDEHQGSRRWSCAVREDGTMEVRRPPTAASLLPIADSNGLSFPGSQVSSKPVWVDIVVVIVVILLAVGAMVMGIAWRRRRRSRKRNDNPVELAHLIPLDSQRS